MKTLAAILLALMQCVAAAADSDSWEQYLTEIYENEEEAAVSMEDAYEHLTALAQQPLDINTVEANDLMQIPGLDQRQINDILKYRHRYGKLRSIEELTMIQSIDRRQRLYLSNFLKVYEENEKAHTHHEVAMTLQIPTYYRAGDKNAPPQYVSWKEQIRRQIPGRPHETLDAILTHRGQKHILQSHWSQDRRRTLRHGRKQLGI